MKVATVLGFLVVCTIIQMCQARPLESSEEGSKKENNRGARDDFVVYTGGNGANISYAFNGSSSQSTENDDRSGHNTHLVSIGEQLATSGEVYENKYEK